MQLSSLEIGQITSAVGNELSIIIPAYNEEEGIESTLLNLIQYFPTAEVIVVNDGSTDGTAEITRTISGVKLLSLDRNCGYGAAIKEGIKFATRSCIAWYDADGQHRAEDLFAVAEPVILGHADVCIGSRGANSARQNNRVLGKFFLSIVAQSISGQRIPDLNCGLRCFRKVFLLRYFHLLPDGFSASTTTTLLALKRRYRYLFIPVIIKERKGKSTVKIIRDGLRTLHLIIRIVVLFDAFRIFTLLGTGLMGVGTLYGLVIAFQDGLGFPTLAGTVVVAGLLTFFMGIIADQVTELRKERFENTDDKRLLLMFEPIVRSEWEQEPTAGNKSQVANLGSAINR